TRSSLPHVAPFTLSEAVRRCKTPYKNPSPAEGRAFLDFRAAAPVFSSGQTAQPGRTDAPVSGSESDANMSSILVTGGCRDLGSNFIPYLLEAEPEVAVVNFDSLTYAGNLANLAELAGHPRYRFVKGDITDRAAVDAVLSGGVRSVVHFAAESHVD